MSQNEVAAFLSDATTPIEIIMPAKKQTLYGIRAEHLALLGEIEQNEGELTPELEQALSLTNEQFQEKAISIAYVIKHFKDNTEAIDAELARLQELKDRAVKRQEMLKTRLSDAMQEFGYEKITTPLLTLSFRKSESVEITDESKLPESCRKSKTVTTIDKIYIRDAIKMGDDVPGAQIVVKQNLQIR